jgi:hypothetical protein
VETTTELLAIGAAACAIAALLVLVRLHLLPGGRPAPLPAVSDYGAGPYHRYYRALVVLLGLAAGLLLAALDRGTTAEALGLTFLGVHAASRIAIAFFMTDLPGATVTTAGRVHIVLAALAFTAIAFGAADITHAIEDTSGWSEGTGSALRVASDAIGVAAVLTLAAYLIPMARARAFGLAERLLYLSSIAWLLLASIHLATLAGGSV